MLKFLTHKLRTQSINEDSCNKKGDENHDSGTESDEEINDSDLYLPGMSECRYSSVSPADTGCSMESPDPGHQDPHSSEEELEVINSNKDLHLSLPLRAASVCLPEKRKWSQVSRRYTPENEENMSHYGNLSPESPCSPCMKFYGDDALLEHSGSSDEEVHSLMANMATPVQFRTSPPLEAVKPGGRMAIGKGRGVSPPSKVVHYEVSPRKRTRHTRHVHMQRPYLDFEKMQQLKARSVTAWKHSGEHGGELSVYCW